MVEFSLAQVSSYVRIADFDEFGLIEIHLDRFNVLRIPKMLPVLAIFRESIRTTSLSIRSPLSRSKLSYRAIAFTI
ncbi:MAG: hypothetical protein D6728_10415 [Cyanobacteria bacterium J055]|nr:MAG: hypothetical protein D6728_10415 [Cyanobacteria bacterium J055]